MRVVLDTNVILSALVFPGEKPDQLLERSRRREFELFVSPFILGELERILRLKFRYTPIEIRERIDSIRRMAKVVEPAERPDLVRAKDDDNRVLECTVTAEADYLVTGDKRDLLSLQKVETVQIVTARTFADSLGLSTED